MRQEARANASRTTLSGFTRRGMPNPTENPLMATASGTTSSDLPRSAREVASARRFICLAGMFSLLAKQRNDDRDRGYLGKRGDAE